MSIHTYTYTCIHIHTSTSICLYIQIYISMCISVHLYTSNIHLYTSLHIYLHLCTSIYIYIHLYTSIYIYVCLYICIHTYIYICLYIYIYIYIYIHMSCCMLTSCFETDLLSRNTQPLPPPIHQTICPLPHSGGRQAHPATGWAPKDDQGEVAAGLHEPAGARHTLRPDEHPRTTKTAATAGHGLVQMQPSAVSSGARDKTTCGNQLKYFNIIVVPKLSLGLYLGSGPSSTVFFVCLPLGTEKFPKPRRPYEPWLSCTHTLPPPQPKKKKKKPKSVITKSKILY